MKRFGLWPTGSEVSTRTPADVSKLGFTVWSTNARTYKTDGPILKPFSRVQVEDKLKEARLFCKEMFLVID